MKLISMIMIDFEESSIWYVFEFRIIIVKIKFCKFLLKSCITLLSFARCQYEALGTNIYLVLKTFCTNLDPVKLLRIGQAYVLHIKDNADLGII